MIIKLLTQITAVLIKMLEALNYIIKVINYGGEHGRQFVRYIRNKRSD